MYEETQSSRRQSRGRPTPPAGPGLADTQPTPRASRQRRRRRPVGRPTGQYGAPPVGASPRPASGRERSPRRSCLARLIPLLMVATVLCGCLGVAAFAAWQSSGFAGRINVLILGLDRRPGQGYVVRSDTLMLATVSPTGPRIGLLSIPRDLYVDIPGYATNRINTAHFWGENEAEGQGTVLAKQTVAQNFGIPVQRFLRVDFDGFRAVIDAVGGIEIEVDDPVVDHAYPTEDYGEITIEIPAGLQHMDGETALQYARSRHGSSDFDRTKRQQQIIVALAGRLLETSSWPRLPAAYQAFVRHVDTDLRIWELVLTAITLLRVGPDGIEHHTIDREMVSPWTTPTGGAVLLPDWERIAPVVQNLFTP
jgi:LCP family protein required for cell wall assembly